MSIALNLEEIIDSEMHKERRNFIKDEENNVKKRFEKYGFQISPSLKLSGNSSEVNIKIAKRGEHTLEFLKEMGISNEEIQQYME